MEHSDDSSAHMAAIRQTKGSPAATSFPPHIRRVHSGLQPGNNPVAAPNNPVAVAAPPIFPGQFGPAAAPGAANGPPVLSGQPGTAAAPGVAHGGIWQGNHLAVAANNPFAVAAAAPPVFTGQPNLSAAPAAAPVPPMVLRSFLASRALPLLPA